MPKRYLISAMLIAAAIALTLLAPSASAAPVGENAEFTVVQGDTLHAVLHGSDEDSGELRYTLATVPVKGTIELHEDGSFIYTPGSSRRGRDYFGYRVIGSDGERSAEATVILRIVRAGKDSPAR